MVRTRGDGRHPARQCCAAPRFLNAPTATATRLPGIPFQPSPAAIHGPPVSASRLRHSSQAHSVDHFASSSPAAPSTWPPDWPSASSQPRLPDDISRQCLNPPPPPGAARSLSKSGNQLSCQRRPHVHGPLLSRRSRPCDQIVSWRHKMGNVKLDGSSQLTTVPGLSWIRLLIITSFLSQYSFLLRNGADTPSRAAHFHFTAYFPIFRPIRILRRL